MLLWLLEAYSCLDNTHIYLDVNAKQLKPHADKTHRNTVVYTLLSWLLRPAPVDYCVHISPPSGLGSLTNDGVYLCLVCTCSMYMWSLYRGCLHMWRLQGHRGGQLRCLPPSKCTESEKAINTLEKVECSVTTVYTERTPPILGFVSGKRVWIYHYALVVAPYRLRSNIWKDQLINFFIWYTQSSLMCHT